MDQRQRRAEFERLYAQHAKAVWAAAYARRLDAELARDVAQEAFARLWQEWQRGGVVDHPRAWLLKVARNLAEDYAKSAFRRHGTLAPPGLNGVPADAAGPPELAARAEAFDQVRDALAELPEGDRELLTWRYAAGYDALAIAELLDLPATAVHMRLTRARHRLAEILSARGLTELP